MIIHTLIIYTFLYSNLHSGKGISTEYCSFHYLTVICEAVFHWLP